jgi:hypothetical protein
MSNKTEQIIQTSVAIQAKRDEVAKVSGELLDLLAGFKKLVKTGRVSVTATPSAESEPGQKRKPSRTKTKILRILRGRTEGVKFSELQEKSGGSQSVVHVALRSLIEEGAVQKLSFGVYGLLKS